jgi:hypothetical protein
LLCQPNQTVPLDDALGWLASKAIAEAVGAPSRYSLEEKTGHRKEVIERNRWRDWRFNFRRAAASAVKAYPRCCTTLCTS